MYINNSSYFWVFTGCEKIKYHKVYYKQQTEVKELEYVTSMSMQDNKRKMKNTLRENKLEYTFCGKLQQHSPNNHMTC